MEAEKIQALEATMALLEKNAGVVNNRTLVMELGGANGGGGDRSSDSSNSSDSGSDSE